MKEKKRVKLKTETLVDATKINLELIKQRRKIIEGRRKIGNIC